MAYLNGKRLYSSYFVSQTFRESLVFFFTGTIPTIGIAIVARRYSFTQACTPHPARGRREKAGGGVGRKGLRLLSQKRHLKMRNFRNGQLSSLKFTEFDFLRKFSVGDNGV